MKCLFFHFFISSKYDFHVDTERMIAKTWKMSKIISVDSYLMAWKIFGRDIYRSHPTIKVAQCYYFLRVTLGILGAQGHDTLAFCLVFLWDSRSPAPYK